jgi:hypothetical protein
MRLNRLRAEIEALMAQDTYFGYLDVPGAIRNGLREVPMVVVTQVRAEMAAYTRLLGLQAELRGGAAAIKGRTEAALERVKLRQ